MTSGDISYVTWRAGSNAREYPHLTFGDGPKKTVRYFPDKLPIGVLPGLDHQAFVYLVTTPSPMDFRLFLLRHVPLLRVLFRWTIRLLFPRSLWRARLVYQHAAREHLGERLEPANVQVPEWLFPERKRLAEPGAAPADERYLKTLIATGQAAQLPYHLNRAMDHGLTQSQAAEALTHLAFYTGWPSVFSALPVAKDVFDKRALKLRLGSLT